VVKFTIYFNSLVISTEGSGFKSLSVDEKDGWRWYIEEDRIVIENEKSKRRMIVPMGSVAYMEVEED
jgi:hypothetical protein